MRHLFILHGQLQTEVRLSEFLQAEERERVELRNPDPSANPYLVLALCLAAGLDGINNKIQPDAELP